MAIRPAWKGRLLLGVAIASGVAASAWWFGDRPDADAPDESETVTRTDYVRPGPRLDSTIHDDILEDKVTGFDPALVDRRPLGAWQVNASEAVVRLDTPMLRPDVDAPFFELRPSYKAAVEKARAIEPGTAVLPSVNMIDGKAKQFDDGLYAAIDRAYFRGQGGAFPSHVELIRRMLAKVGPDSLAAPYLAAGLKVARVDAAVKDEAVKAVWLSRFEADLARSKPFGFYTWDATLADCFRFLRYFQEPFPRGELPVARAIADALKSDPALLADYRKAVAFYAKLTNPSRDASLADLVDGKATIGGDRPIVLLPEATSTEAELFNRIFPVGSPPEGDLMMSLIRKIRSSEVSLAPRPESGWYDYQVFALETLISPDRGEEANKLLLTRVYKERMLEAFKALITKRRETHARNLKTAEGAMKVEMPEVIGPRLRLEPCPSYYLRTARAYGFLANFLDAAVGVPALEALHGLREGGERPLGLRPELLATRDLFYGFYLLSAEDIGMRPSLHADEPVDRDRCEEAARAWLADPLADPDMAVDARISVPISYDPARGTTRLWATLGVRLARLEAGYARSPQLRPRDGGGDWTRPEPRRLGTVRYLIAVDEFAEVQIRGVRPLTRDELRSACEASKTKESIVSALRAAK